MKNLSKDELLEKIVKHFAFSTNDFEHNKPKDFMPEFERLFSYTNEDLYTLFESTPVAGKYVLTVGSSGDQVLYALAYGAKSVTLFDTCGISKYFFDLKVAMIKNLDYNEYLAQNFEGDSANDFEKFFPSNLYQKISHDIKGQSREFWDELYLNNFDDFRYYLFINSDGYYMPSKQYSKDLYERIKSAIQSDIDVKFINCNMSEIDKVLPEKQKFDLILLSNISDYAIKSEERGNISAKKFKKVLSLLQKRLTPNGKIQVGYAYSLIEPQVNFLRNELGTKDIYPSKFLCNEFDESAIMLSPKRKKEHFDEMEQ